MGSFTHFQFGASNWKVAGTRHEKSCVILKRHTCCSVELLVSFNINVIRLSGGGAPHRKPEAADQSFTGPREENEPIFVIVQQHSVFIHRHILHLPNHFNRKILSIFSGGLAGLGLILIYA